MTIKDLHNKIINLETFLQRVSCGLSEKIGFTRVIFLICKEENRSIALHNSLKMSVYLTRTELNIIKTGSHNESYWSINDLRCECFHKKIILIKIKWKLWLHGISAIMPIYYDNELICLFLFKHQFIDKQRYCLKNIRQEITDCLASILLYNQTLEDIIKNYHDQMS